MKIRNLFMIRPDLGAITKEPSLWSILFRYYNEHFDADMATGLTERYIKKIEKTVEEELLS